MAEQRKINHENYAKLLKMLLQEPITAHDVVEELGLHIVNVQGFMRTLKKHKVVRICAWEADRLGRDCTPVYKLGKGRDKPRRQTPRAEISRRYREKKKMLALTNIVSFKPAESSESYGC